MHEQGRFTCTWGEAVAGLRVGIGFQGPLAEFCLQNVGAIPVTVLSHVQAGDSLHLDWFSLRHLAADGSRRVLVFTGERDRSAVIRRVLEPDGVLVHRVDLGTWSRSPANGGVDFEAEGEAVLIYEVRENEDVWQGHLEVTAAVPC